MPEIQGVDTAPQSVTNLEEILCNYCFEINVVKTCKSFERPCGMDIIFHMRMVNQTIGYLRINAIKEFTQTSS
jgi:hypothetical protein